MSTDFSYVRYYFEQVASLLSLLINYSILTVSNELK